MEESWTIKRGWRHRGRHLSGQISKRAIIFVTFLLSYLLSYRKNILMAIN